MFRIMIYAIRVVFASANSFETPKLSIILGISSETNNIMIPYKNLYLLFNKLSPIQKHT